MLYKKIISVVVIVLCLTLAMPVVHALAKIGTFTQHQFAVFQDSSDAPGTQIGADNQSVTLNASTKYWLVIQVEPTADADEIYIGLQYDIWGESSWKDFNESTVTRDAATQWAFASTAKQDLDAAPTHFTDTTNADQKKEYIVQHLETIDSAVWDDKNARGEVWYPINTTNPSSDTTYELRFVRSITQNSGATAPDTIVTRVNITVTASVDSTAPTVALNSPANNSNVSLINISFNFTGTDSSGILNATLYANFSGTWEANESITSGLVNGQSALINVTDVPEGGFIWNVYVCDNAGTPNCGFNTTGNFTLTVDRTAPNITLEYPADNAYNDTSDPVAIDFNCSATDNLGLVNISLYITNSTNQSFSFNQSTDVTGINASANWTLSLSNGNYTWNCLTYDIAGNFDWGDSNRSIEINASAANNPPTIANMSVDDATASPAEEIDLSPGTTREVNCTGTSTDQDGATEISAVNATFFHSTLSSPTATDNNETHYTNTSCTLGSAFGNSKNFTCSFQVRYYATNGSWTCNATVVDTSSATGSGINTTTVNTLLGLTIPDFINYGTISPGGTSSIITIVVNNSGNIEMDLGVDGYGTADGDGLAMNCTLGNISIGQEKYNLTSPNNGLDYDVNMTSLTDSQVTETTFNLRKANDTLTASNSTYWALRLPSGVGGNCTGVVNFRSVAS